MSDINGHKIEVCCKMAAFKTTCLGNCNGADCATLVCVEHSYGPEGKLGSTPINFGHLCESCYADLVQQIPEFVELLKRDEGHRRSLVIAKNNEPKQCIACETRGDLGACEVCDETHCSRHLRNVAQTSHDRTVCTSCIAKLADADPTAILVVYPRDWQRRCRSEVIVATSVFDLSDTAYTLRCPRCGAKVEVGAGRAAVVCWKCECNLKLALAAAGDGR